MKQVQALIVTVMLVFALAQTYKYLASRATRAACAAYKPGDDFSAVSVVKYAVDKNIRDAIFTELSSPVPDPLNIDNPVSTVPVVIRGIKRDAIIPVAYTKIDEKKIGGKVSLVTKVGFATYTCNIDFAGGKVIKSLGTW